MTLLGQLASHLIGDVASKAITAQIVRSFGLNDTQVRQVASGHILQAAGFLMTCQTWRLESVNRLLHSQLARQIHVTPEHSSASPMNEEQGRPGSGALHFNKRGTTSWRCLVYLLAQNGS